MELVPDGGRVSRLETLTFRLNDFMEDQEWQALDESSHQEVRWRIETLEDGRRIFARQYRNSSTEALLGCRISILDDSKIIPHEMEASWEPTISSDYEFGIEEIEPALEEVIGRSETS